MENKVQKIFFASNIKMLRERKKLTQEALAEKLCVTRKKLYALEAGLTKAPQPEDLINFSNFFKVSIDTLLKIDLRKLTELKLRQLEAGNDVYINGGNLRVLAISVDKDDKENVEYVPIKAKAGYAASYSDPEFIAALPKFSIPNLPRNATFRIFPITGDSMLPVPDGSDITAKYVTDWSSIKADTPCIVVMKGQDFVFKLVTLVKGQLLLRSLNSLYDPYHVPVEEVLEIWEFYSYQSRYFPQQATDMAALMKMVRDLQEDVRSIKG